MTTPSTPLLEPDAYAFILLTLQYNVKDIMKTEEITVDHERFQYAQFNITPSKLRDSLNNEKTWERDDVNNCYNLFYRDNRQATTAEQKTPPLWQNENTKTLTIEATASLAAAILVQQGYFNQKRGTALTIEIQKLIQQTSVNSIKKDGMQLDTYTITPTI